MPFFILVNTEHWLTFIREHCKRSWHALAWPKGKTTEWLNIFFYADMKHGSAKHRISRSVIPSVDRSTNLSCNTLMTGNVKSFGFTRVWSWFLWDYDGNWSKQWATQKFWTEIDAARHPRTEILDRNLCPNSEFVSWGVGFAIEDTWTGFENALAWAKQPRNQTFASMWSMEARRIRFPEWKFVIPSVEGSTNSSFERLPTGNAKSIISFEAMPARSITPVPASIVEVAAPRCRTVRSTRSPRW